MTLKEKTMLNKLGFYLVKNKLNREFVFLFAQFSQSENWSFGQKDKRI